MPKFLVGCHYNEEEISWHLNQNIGYWPVQINGNKFATGQILKNTVEVVKGWDFNWLSSKVSWTLGSLGFMKSNSKGFLRDYAGIHFGKYLPPTVTDLLLIVKRQESVVINNYQL